MTTNLFIIPNVKQLRTGGSFGILLSFFRTSVLAKASTDNALPEDGVTTP